MKKFFYFLIPGSFLFSAGCATASDMFDSSSFQNTSLDYEDTQTQVQTKISVLPSKPSISAESLDDAISQVEPKNLNSEIALEQNNKIDQNRRGVEPAPLPDTPPGISPNETTEPDPSLLPAPSTVDQDAKFAPSAPLLNSPTQATTASTKPRILPLGEVGTFSTQIPINGTFTNHLFNYDFLGGIRFGSTRETAFLFNATKLFSPYIEDRTSKNGVYRSEYNNTYVQTRSVRQGRNFSLMSENGAQVRDDVTSAPSLGVGRVRQVIVNNGEQSGIGRTVRGLNYSFGDRNALLNTGLQLLTEVLPNSEPSLSPSKTKSNKPLIHNANLVLAANNLRLPDNSLTAYSAGWGYALNPVDDKAVQPPANYNSLWVGLSPMVERSASATGTMSQLRERNDFYPHVSFTGSTATTDSTFRYYTGALFNTGVTPLGLGVTADSPPTAPTSKIYGGVDYSAINNSGLGYNASLIGYTNSDIDNYSRASANISQRIGISDNPAHNIVVSAGANYAFDGTSIINNQTFKTGSSYINTAAALNLGDFTFSTTYFLPNSFPDRVDSLLSTSVAWRIQNNLAVSAYYVPIDQNISKSPYGVNASLRLGAEPNSPSLVLDWKRFDNTVDNKPTTENVLGVFLRFGESYSPKSFAPAAPVNTPTPPPMPSSP